MDRQKLCSGINTGQTMYLHWDKRALQRDKMTQHVDLTLQTSPAIGMATYREMVTVNNVSDIFKFSSHIILQMDELIAGIDLRQVLTKEQCVQVSINSFCTGSAASFQVQLRFSRGFCEENASQTIIPYRQTTRHCIHTKSISNCFSVVVFNNEGVEISASD